MARKSPVKKKPKMTDAERHARFKEAARDVGASDNPKDFDEAFKAITDPLRRRTDKTT